MISQWTVVSVFNKIFNFFVSHLFVIYFLSFQLFVFSALWSSQPFELPSFLVSKLFGPPKMSLVLQPPVAWLMILRTGATMMTTLTMMTWTFDKGTCCAGQLKKKTFSAKKQNNNNNHKNTFKNIVALAIAQCNTDIFTILWKWYNYRLHNILPIDNLTPLIMISPYFDYLTNLSLLSVEYLQNIHSLCTVQKASTLIQYLTCPFAHGWELNFLFIV